MKTCLCLSALLWIVGVTQGAEQRVVSVGGPITEIIYALGQESTLVGVDSSCQYPEAATKLPQVGYQRQLATEGVLSLRPTLIIASDEAGPPAVIEQLKQSGGQIVIVTAPHSLDGVKEKIRTVARVLNCQDRGDQLIRHLEDDAAKADFTFTSNATPPRVLFIYARGVGTLNVSGEGTAADAMIALSGGVNAVKGYHGYKPLTPEAVIAAAPEVILIPAHGLESLGGADKLLAQPGLAQTPAGQHHRIIAMDDLYLLGFGPRTGQAIAELAKRLQPGD